MDREQWLMQALEEAVGPEAWNHPVVGAAIKKAIVEGYDSVRAIAFGLKAALEKPKLNAKLIIDGKMDVGAGPTCLIFGTVVGNNFGVKDGHRRFIRAHVEITELSQSVPPRDTIEGILEDHLTWDKAWSPQEWKWISR